MDGDCRGARRGWVFEITAIIFTRVLVQLQNNILPRIDVGQ